MIITISMLLIALAIALAIRGSIVRGKLLKEGIDVEAVPSRLQYRKVSRQRRNPSSQRIGKLTEYFALFIYSVNGEEFEASSAPQRSAADAQAILDTEGVLIRHSPTDPANGIVILPGSQFSR